MKDDIKNTAKKAEEEVKKIDLKMQSIHFMMAVLHQLFYIIIENTT
jgi:hypothetical protein